MMRVSFCEVSPRSNAVRSSGTMIVIASASPMYGSSTARQPAPAAYGSMHTPIPWQRTRFIIGTVTREPSARLNWPGFVSAAVERVQPRRLEVHRVDEDEAGERRHIGLGQAGSGIRPAVCLLTQALTVLRAPSGSVR